MNDLFVRYPVLKENEESFYGAVEALISTFEAGGKLLICGNGGSCADADHISGELLKGFLLKRPLSAEKKAAMKAACSTLTDEELSVLQEGLPAIPLPSLTALSTAFSNDCAPEAVFAQAVLALGDLNDTLLCLSTSGNSANVLAAAKVAQAKGMTVISLTGKGGGKLKELSDFLIAVPETETYKVQELHLPVYHELCALTEAHFFAK